MAWVNRLGQATGISLKVPNHSRQSYPTGTNAGVYCPNVRFFFPKAFVYAYTVRSGIKLDMPAPAEPVSSGNQLNRLDSL
jgi:hypothetical protein